MPDTAQSREAVLMEIVKCLALVEKKASFNEASHFVSGSFDRGWLIDAFGIARQCLDGPPTPEPETPRARR